jgi:hypothetical protein
MSMMDSALGMTTPFHQSLIPPQLLARLAGNMQPMAGGMSPMDNPARQLQNAHNHVRNRRNQAGMRPNDPSSGVGPSPMQRSVMAAKTAQDQQADSQQQDAPPPGAGTMSIQQGSGRDGRPVMNAARILDAGDKFTRENQIMGKTGETANAFWDTPPAAFLQPGTAQQVSNQLQHAQNIGYQVTGAGQPQPAQQNPWGSVLSQFKGHLPDEQLSLVDQGVQNGMLTPQQGFQHLYSAMQQSQAGQARQQSAQGREHTQQTRQQLSDLRRQNQQIMHQHRDIDWGGDASQFAGDDQTTQQYRQLFNQYHQNEQTMDALTKQLEGGGGQNQPANEQQGKEQWSGGHVSFGGQQFQVGQVIQGRDGKPYKITGNTHPDGSPEVVPAQ